MCRPLAGWPEAARATSARPPGLTPQPLQAHPTPVLVAAGGASSSHITGASQPATLARTVPLPLISSAQSRSSVSPVEVSPAFLSEEEERSHLSRRLPTYGLTPRGYREKGAMRNSCRQLTPRTSCRASDNGGRNTAKGNPKSHGAPDTATHFV